MKAIPMPQGPPTMFSAGPVQSVGKRRPSASKSTSDLGSFGSYLFPFKILDFHSGSPEMVVLGGRDKFPQVDDAFKNVGIKQVLIIGWGSQGPGQAPNLRDTFKTIGSDIKVCVGLRPNSKNIPDAIEKGFNQADGTLGEPLALATKSDLIICLIADGGMVEFYPELLKAAKPGAIIGISHGFIVGHLTNIGQELPEDHDLIMVAPKGMGPSVRKLYLQGLETEGAGINSSVAVHTRNPDRLDLIMDVANAWSVGIGSPVTFGTSFLREVTSDLFGERSMLLGGLWGMSEALFKFYFEHCENDFNTAFRSASSGITGTVTDSLSKLGIKGFYESLTSAQKVNFRRGYSIGYPAFDGVMDEIYQEVSSMREIRTVIEATKRLADHPMGNIEAESVMWKNARKEKLYGERIPMNFDLAFSAGVYVSGLMAQMQTLLYHGHNVSEVVNESFIEAVDSLTPYMDARGVTYMVDNCSTTARLGTRLWGPVFRTELLKVLYGMAPSTDQIAKVWRTFEDEPLHHDIALCMAHRPSVRIAIAAN